MSSFVIVRSDIGRELQFKHPEITHVNGKTWTELHDKSPKEWSEAIIQVIRNPRLDNYEHVIHNDMLLLEASLEAAEFLKIPGVIDGGCGVFYLPFKALGRVTKKRKVVDRKLLCYKKRIVEDALKRRAEGDFGIFTQSFFASLPSLNPSSYERQARWLLKIQEKVESERAFSLISVSSFESFLGSHVTTKEFMFSFSRALFKIKGYRKQKSVLLNLLMRELINRESRSLYSLMKIYKVLKA